MTIASLQRAWVNMPIRDQRIVAEARDPLLRIADDIPEEILGVLAAAPNVDGFSALVITPGRIIEMTTGGRMEVLDYSTISTMQAVGGAKKRFSSKHGAIFLRITLIGGSLKTYPLFGEYEYNARMSSAAEAACNTFQLRRYPIHGQSAVSSPPTQSQSHHGGASAPRSGPAPVTRSASSAPASAPGPAITCNNSKCDAFGLKTPLAYCDMCGAPTGVVPVLGARPATVTLDTWSRVCDSSDCDAVGIPTNQSVCDVCGHETTSR
jgi:hypothetical protein